MDEFKVYNPDEINIEEETKVVYVRVSDAVGLLWDDNPKLHNIEELILSIQKYGFQSPPKYDNTLGSIKAGNGRIEALQMMENAGYDVPRGIGIADDGSWLIPISVGVDALDEFEAIAYALEDNNITLSGGDFTPHDTAKMYDGDGYLALLEELARTGNVPVSIGKDGLDVLFERIKQDKETEEEREERVKSGGTECPNCGFIF